MYVPRRHFISADSFVAQKDAQTKVRQRLLDWQNSRNLPEMYVNLPFCAVRFCHWLRPGNHSRIFLGNFPDFVFLALWCSCSRYDCPCNYRREKTQYFEFGFARSLLPSPLLLRCWNAMRTLWAYQKTTNKNGNSHG